MEPTQGTTFISVGDDKQIKHWRLVTEEAQSGAAYPEPLFAVISKSALLGLSHHLTRPQFATCGDAVQVWDHHRFLLISPRPRLEAAEG